MASEKHGSLCHQSPCWYPEENNSHGHYLSHKDILLSEYEPGKCSITFMLHHGRPKLKLSSYMRRIFPSITSPYHLSPKNKVSFLVKSHCLICILQINVAPVCLESITFIFSELVLALAAEHLHYHAVRRKPGNAGVCCSSGIV
ncbi:hypothetical protein VPH35_104104 [Triticum aestivum]